MAYNPVSGTAPQYQDSNSQNADGYYLKYYVANTTTPLPMATDSTGATTLIKCKLNPDGFPITNPLDNDTVFIPYVNQSYRQVIYRNETDADNNDTASALVNIAEVSPLVSGVIGTAPSEIPLNSDLGSLAYENIAYLYVDSLVDLPEVVTGQQINAAGYHAGTTVGGGRFVGIASGRHNGGTLIDPNRSAEIGTAAYYVDSGVDVACWERTDYDWATVRYGKNTPDTRKTRAGYNFNFINRRVLFEPNAGAGEVGNMRPNLCVANSPIAKYHLYYNIDYSTGLAVSPGDPNIVPALATSDDLENWTFQGTITSMSSDDFSSVVDFNVHYDNGLGKFVAYYCSGESPSRVIRRAESDDGKNFITPSTIVGSFGADDVRYPSALNFGGLIYLYYMQLVGSNWEIRLMTSEDGGFTFTQYSGNPVMTHTPSLAYEDLHVFDPHPVILDNIIMMAYTSGENTSTYGAAFTERLCVATSLDGHSFGRSNANPILSPTNIASDPDEMWVIDPNLFFDGDKLYIIYTGQSVVAGVAGVRRLMIAEATQNPQQ
jgi:hypothetical protein